MASIWCRELEKMNGFVDFGARSPALSPPFFFALFGRILGAPAVHSVLSSEKGRIETVKSS